MAHTTTLLSQMLSLIPRHVFQKLETRHKTGRASRQFGFKEQFTFLAFIHLAACRSMRDGIRLLCAVKTKLYHLGLKSIARSTIADANATRPVAFFQDLFAEMFALCAHKAPSHKFRFKAKLYSMDATTISLCLSLFPWAKFRKAKGGVKMNTVLDHDGYIPAFATIRPAKTHESQMHKSLSLPKGSILAFDKGYINYAWFSLLCTKGLSFVTRLKENAVYTLVRSLAVDPTTGVTSDQIIDVRYGKNTLRLRLVEYTDAETGKEYKFLTNHMRLAARTIADIYKERWQIEIFFREIKQNLRIKSFIGNSENAVLIQLYTALTVYLMLAYQKFISKATCSIQFLFQLISRNLFINASLQELVKPPGQQQKESYSYSMLPLLAA